jgi:hypothetical protein
MYVSIPRRYPHPQPPIESTVRSISDDLNGSSKTNCFGLAGLLNSVNSNGAGLFVGNAITVLSPSVDDTVQSAKTFLSAWCSERDSMAVIQNSEFTIPNWYLRQGLNGRSELQLTIAMFKSLPLDPLFYCFYFLPSDVLQSVAAQELLSRGWRYHTVERGWFRPATVDDGLVPSLKNFVHFNLNEWKEKLFQSTIDLSKFLASSDYTSSPLPPLATLSMAPPNQR